MASCAVGSLQLDRLAEAEAHLSEVVRTIGKLAEVSSARRDREGEQDGVLRAMSALGDVYARQLRVDLAKATYKKVLKALPQDTETLLKLGSLQQWLGGLRSDPMEWVDALTAHASALRTPKMEAASEKGRKGKSRKQDLAAEEKRGASLADAYRSAPEIHLRMAALLELVANHGVTGRGLSEAADHVSSALEMADMGSALGWRALFTQQRLDTRLCAWQQRRSQTAVTTDFLSQALHAKPRTAEEISAAIAAAEAAAQAAEEEEKALTARDRKRKRKEAKKRKKQEARKLENLLAAQAGLAAGADSVPTVPLSPFELWQLPYFHELGTLTAAAARAHGNSTHEPQAEGTARVQPPVPEDRRVVVGILFPSWWDSSLLELVNALLRAHAAHGQLELVVYNLAGDATVAAATLKAVVEETWEASAGAVRMVEAGCAAPPTVVPFPLC